jgi:hypothetical protein
VVAGGWLYPNGVELSGFRKLLADFREPWNNAAAVAVNADRATFPVAFAGLVGMLSLALQGFGGTIDTCLWVLISEPLDT